MIALNSEFSVEIKNALNFIYRLNKFMGLKIFHDLTFEIMVLLFTKENDFAMD